MASRFWIENRGHDRRRFVELVTQFARVEHDPKRISLPLLVQDRAEWQPIAKVAEKPFRLTADNDKADEELLAINPTRSPADRSILRRYSYANILYEDIRCGFAHTYLPSDNARTDDPLAGVFGCDPKQISYVNRMDKNMRQIYFPLGWITSVAKCVAEGMDQECIRRNKKIGENLCIALPQLWWIDEYKSRPCIGD